MSTSERRALLQEARAAVRSLRADVREAAARLAMLRAAVEQSERGEGDATYSRPPGLVDAFVPVVEGTLAALTESLEDIAETYHPTALEDQLARIESAYRVGDRDTIHDALGQVIGLFEGHYTDEFRQAVNDLLDAIVNRDDARVSDALDRLGGLYDETYDQRLAEPLAHVERIFGPEYETTAEPHVEAFRSAFEAGDYDAATDALDDLTDAFDRTGDAVLEARLTAIESAIAADDNDEVETGLETFETELSMGRDRLETLRSQRDETHADYVDALPADPSAVLDELAGDQPVLTLPVQLETRFEYLGHGETKLKIRVYPDDVHVDSHEPELTPPERRAGVRFWKQVWWASHDLATETLFDRLADSPAADVLAAVDQDGLPAASDARHAAVLERAWSTLVDEFGAERAAYVKAATAPAEADALLDGPRRPEDVATPAFDALGADAGVRPGSWTRPPRARLLPDRWVAFVDDGTTVQRVVGSAVQEELAIGPDPDAVGSIAGDDVDGEADLAWAFDYDRALEVGMALETTLAARDAQSGVDVTVVGVKSSLDATESAAAVRDLLDAHHYTDGLAMLPPGTSTNNTGDSEAPYASTDDARASMAVECGPSLVEGDGVRTDGEKLARLLALSPDQLGAGSGDGDRTHVFGHVAGADGTSQADARAMNAALWSATWGYYVPHMLAPESWEDSTFGDYDTLFSQLSGFREHFVEHVRARGPFPTLRVGAQPYGLLPTTAFDEWGTAPVSSPASTPPSGSGDYDPRRPALPDVTDDVVDLVDVLRQFWAGSLSNVPRVGGTDTTEQLLSLLSMRPTAFGYRPHDLVGWHGLSELLFGSPTPPDPGRGALAQALWNKTNAVADGSTTATLRNAVAPGSTDVPRIARLLFSESVPFYRGATGPPLEPLVAAGTTGFIESLLETPFSLLTKGRPGTTFVESGTQFEGASGLVDEITDLYNELGGPNLDAGAGDSLLAALLYYATLVEHAHARYRLEDRFRLDPTSPLGYRYADPLKEELPVPELDGDETLLEALADRVPASLAEHPALDEDSTFLDAVTAAAEVDRAQLEIDAEFRSFHESLEYLVSADHDPARLERLLTETLDLATHRLDAWATSAASRRLANLRAATDDADDGLYVGAYGTVTDLTPEDSDSAGFIHAPSQGHAVTAAVLRSSHLEATGGREELLSIDLSPGRVRRATDLLDGLRGGQSLAELLGARFERGLHEHDRDLDEYVIEFRRLDPSVAGKADAPPADAEAIRDVVDGYALYRRTTGERDPIPWGERVAAESVDPLPAGASADAAAIESVLDEIDETIDAVRDVLTAEGMHALVNGRPMQGGASLDALARGESPPELTVTETPRTGTGVTHRLLVTFADVAAPPADATPRAHAAPAVNDWVASVLPPDDELVCLCEYVSADAAPHAPPETAVVTFADLDIAHVDLLAVGQSDEAEASELEQRVAAHVSRTHGLAPDARLELTFAPVDEWPYAAAELEGVDSLDGLVGFAELLEVVRVIGEVVDSGRAAKPADLSPPGEGRRSSATYDADALEARATTAVTALNDAVAAFESPLSVLEPGEDGRAVVDELVDVTAALEALPAASDLRALGDDLSAVAGTTLFADLQTVASTFDGPLVDLETVDGSVTVAPAAGQSIVGQTVATPGTELRVTVTGGSKTRGADVGAVIGRDEDTTGTGIDVTERTTVASDGSFAVTVDFETAIEGATFEVTVAGPAGDIATVPGEVTTTATGQPSVASLSPSSAPALDAFLEAGREVNAVVDEVPTLDAALGAADRAALDAALSGLAWSDLSTLADWRSEWSTEAATHVNALFDLASADLPGLGRSPGQAPWSTLSALADQMVSGIDPVYYDASTRAALVQSLESITTGTDASTWGTEVDATFAALESGLDALATGVEQGTPAGAAARFGLAEALRDALLSAAALGVRGALPTSPNGVPGPARSNLVAQGTSVRSELLDRQEELPSAGTDAEAAAHRARLEAVFGDDITVLPPLSVPNEQTSELTRALTPAHSETLQLGDPTEVETWFKRASRLRDRPRSLGRLFSYADALGAGASGSRLRVGQLPFRQDDIWIGLPEAWDGDPPGGKLSLVVHPSMGGTGAPAAGLFVDEWVETVPSDTETTGLTFQHDTPTNRPPQSMLLAVPPDDTGWSEARLESVVDETMAFAQFRSVDTDALASLGHYLPAVVAATAGPPDPGGPARVGVDLSDLETEESGGGD